MLLIDELDKLDDVELEFLFGKGQSVFEKLYVHHSFICIFSGHKSWVERIHSGSEYTYYHGETLEANPLIDLKEVENLIVSRLGHFPLFMKQSDVPWTEDGYNEIRTLTRGVPRRIIKQTTEVMNFAAKQHSETITSRVVKDTMSKGQSPKIADYLEGHGELYLKLKQSLADSSFELLPLFHQAYSHRIEKTLDNQLDQRTRILGPELDNHDWIRKIGYLERIGLLSADANFRLLDKEADEFFDFVQNLVVSYHLIPEILRELQITPIISTEGEPDYSAAIKRVFETSSGWIKYEEAFGRFLDTTAINNYFFARRGASAPSEAREKFEEFLPLYVFKDPNLLIFGDEFRRISNNLVRDSIQNLIELFKDKPLADLAITLFEQKEYGLGDRDRFLELLGRLFKCLGTARHVGFELGDITDESSRMQFMDSVQMPGQVRERLEFLRRESSHPSHPALIKELLVSAVNDVCSLASEPQTIFISSDTPFANRLAVRSFLSRLSGEVNILDRDMDEQGLQILYSLKNDKVKSIRILAHSREGRDFASAAKSFVTEFEKTNILVELRIATSELPSDVHGRFVADDQRAFRTPPMNNMTRKFDEIAPTDRRKCMSIFEKHWTNGKKFP